MWRSHAPDRSQSGRLRPALLGHHRVTDEEASSELAFHITRCSAEPVPILISDPFTRALHCLWFRWQLGDSKVVSLFPNIFKKAKTRRGVCVDQLFERSVDHIFLFHNSSPSFYVAFRV